MSVLCHSRSACRLRAFFQWTVAVSHRTIWRVRPRQANLVNKASHNASWSTSLTALEWKHSPITGCTVFPVSRATVITSWKLFKATRTGSFQSVRISSVTSCWQNSRHWRAHHVTKRQRLDVKAEKQFCWPHDWSRFARSRWCSSHWSSSCWSENHFCRSPSHLHTSMNFTGDRALISSAPASRQHTRSPAVAAGCIEITVWHRWFLRRPPTPSRWASGGFRPPNSLKSRCSKSTA